MYVLVWFYVFFFFKQKTAYEMRISDWSSDVCSSDLSMTPRPGKEYSMARTPPSDRPGNGRYAAPARAQRPAPAIRPWHARPRSQIGRASCRERVCQYV